MGSSNINSLNTCVKPTTSAFAAAAPGRKPKPGGVPQPCIRLEVEKVGCRDLQLQPPSAPRRRTLAEAAFAGDCDEIQRCLQDCQAGVEQVSPIVAAVLGGHLHSLELLLDCHQSPITTAGYTCQSPLTLAVTNGRGDMAQLLLKHGARVGPEHIEIAARLGDTWLKDCLSKALAADRCPPEAPTPWWQKALFAYDPPL